VGRQPGRSSTPQGLETTLRALAGQLCEAQERRCYPLNRSRDLTLVVGTASSIFSATTPGHQRSDIHYAGYVGDDDLAALYEAALCLAFPSKTKGFGIPPLEAMAGGRPVISLNAASLVEVGRRCGRLCGSPITATAGATRSLAWQETWIFAQRWRRGGEREPRCFPGNAARGSTSMKSCACALSRGLSYLLKISHAREAHIARLRASARIQGHGDDPRRPHAVLSPACRIARSIRRIRLTVGPASKDRSLNSDIAVPCRTKLCSAGNSTNGFAEWFNCG
jgi:hypothetical protein